MTKIGRSLQLALEKMQVDHQITTPDLFRMTAFLVGQDGEGHWLAVEIHGLGGGIFSSRDKAIRYANDECRHQPGAIRFADGPIRLFAL